jgi:XTP/dITP diphosphohydrolase
MARPILVLGTHNRKKGIELAELLGPHGIELRTLAEYDNASTVDETGDTFAANAILKATQQACHLGHWVLGEDSGLAVDALGGAPGIFSARYAGADSDDDRNNQHLLDELGETPPEKRQAHYVCHAALSDPAGQIRAQSEARCLGRIRFEPVGNAGFGYDPLFEIVEYHRTFAELGNVVKSVLSHRSRALRIMTPLLLAAMRTG